MKKKKNIFLIIFLCLFLSLTVTMRADSGWDGDYDSGSSWDSGGSSWDWGSSSSDHHWSSSNRHDRVDSADDLGSAFLIMGVFFTICIVITAVIITTQKNKNNQNRFNNNTNDIQYNFGYDINKIKEILPGFDANEFRTSTFDIYKKIQIAWMDFDYDTLKELTTNELYNLYKSELIALKAKKQKNIMENFSLLNFRVTDIEKGTDDVSIKVRMNVMCKDYVVDQNNTVMRGNKNRMVTYDYEMTFTKGLKTKDNKCPNCNAPLENVQTSTCPYCGSTVISDNHDWVLSKKQVKSQR